jgi:hypothetical protein
MTARIRRTPESKPTRVSFARRESTEVFAILLREQMFMLAVLSDHSSNCDQPQLVIAYVPLFADVHGR